MRAHVGSFGDLPKRMWRRKERIMEKLHPQNSNNRSQVVVLRINPVAAAADLKKRWPAIMAYIAAVEKTKPPPHSY